MRTIFATQIDDKFSLVNVSTYYLSIILTGANVGLRLNQLFRGEAICENKGKIYSFKLLFIVTYYRQLSADIE